MGGRATNQLLKRHLEGKKDLKKASSYTVMGRMIERFHNHYVNGADKIALIPPVGFEKEKATLATPPY